MAVATEQVIEVRHPLVQHKLSYLRQQDTPTVHFRKIANEVTLLLTYEATKDFPTEDVEIETPLEKTIVQRISGKKVAVCPVLRAGMGMLDGVLSLVSGARVGFIGLYRDEETLEPVEYYVKLPSDLADRDAIVLDPMLATGNSSVAAIAKVKDAGARTVTLVTLVSAPEGIERVHSEHPDVRIVTAAIDRGLNEKGYIVPGLGDAGDRLYGTRWKLWNYRGGRSVGWAADVLAERPRRWHGATRLDAPTRSSRSTPTRRVYRALAFREPESPRGYLERVLPEGTAVECWFGDPIVSGDRAAVEWWGSWVEEGKELTLAGTTVLRFDADGQVIDHRDYWNEVAGREAPYAGWGQ